MAKKGTAVAVWDQQMAEAAKVQAAAETVTGSYRSIGTRHGILTIDDTPIKGNELSAVVLMSIHENAYYTGAYDPNTPQVPVCFAFCGEGEDEADMKPHPDSAEPQCESCADCELNQMGSADTGRGKACKNVRRLGLVPADAVESVAAFEEAEVRVLKLPVTSGKNWARYVQKIADEVERPSWGLITLISAVQDAKTQFKINFSFEGLVNFTQPLFDAVQSKRAELAKELVLPYVQPAEDAPTPKRSKAAPKRGKVVTKPAPARTPGNRGAVKRGKY